MLTVKEGGLCYLLLRRGFAHISQGHHFLKRYTLIPFNLGPAEGNMKEIMLPHLVEWFENEFRLRFIGGGGGGKGLRLQ